MNIGLIRFNQLESVGRHFFKVTVDLQGCLPENAFFTRCFEQNIFRIRIGNKRLNAKITVRAKLRYQASGPAFVPWGGGGGGEGKGGREGGRFRSLNRVSFFTLLLPCS